MAATSIPHRLSYTEGTRLTTCLPLLVFLCVVLDKPGPPNSLQSEEGHVPGPTEYPELVPGQNWACFRDQRWGAGVSANQEAELNSSTDDYGPATGDFSPVTGPGRGTQVGYGCFTEWRDRD